MIDGGTLVWLLHGAAGNKDEWLLAVIVVAGSGAAIVGRWFSARRRAGPHDDEPI